MNFFKRIMSFNDNINEFILNNEEKQIDYDEKNEKEKTAPDIVSSDIEENEAYIRKRYSIPLNNDFVIRNIKLKNDRKAFVVFIDGMVDTESVDLAIIKSMQELPYFTDDEIYKYEEEISERFISHSQSQISDDMDIVAEEVNFGSCAVFVDKISKAFIFDVRSWGTRSIDKPENEQSIYGPQEAFAEMLRNNTALVRKIIKTEKLIAEGS